MWLLTVFPKPQTLEHPGEICQLSDPATDVERQIMRQSNVGLLMMFVGNVVKWAILLRYVIPKRNHSQLSQGPTVQLDLLGHPEQIFWKQTRLAVLWMIYIFLL